MCFGGGVLFFAWAVSALVPGHRAVHHVVAEGVGDAEQLVVLGVAVGAAGSAGLDLAAVGRHGDVGDRRVFGLAGAVAEHGGVVVADRQVHRVKGLSEGADLVDLHEDRVGGVVFDAALEELLVRDEQSVANELNLVADLLGQQLPAVPVVFRQAVFDGVDRVLGAPLGSEVDHGGGADDFRAGAEELVAFLG